MTNKLQKIINKVDNKTIKKSFSRENRNQRRVVIYAPSEVKAIFKMGKEEIKNIIPYLIKAMESSLKDWAANLILYALTQKPAGGIQFLKTEEWRKLMGKSEYIHWKLWWEKYKDQITWNGIRLNPTLVEILHKKAEKKGVDSGKLYEQEMKNFIIEYKEELKEIFSQKKVESQSI